VLLVATPTPRTLGAAFIRVMAIAMIVPLLIAGSAVMLSEALPKNFAFAFHAQLVDQDPSPTLAPGATTAYTIRFRNTGLLPWQRGTSRQVNLGVVDDSLEVAASIALGWLEPTRPATTSEELVLPGMIGTFTFNVRAPATPGVYKVALLPVAEGITWLEEPPVTFVLKSDLGFHSQLLDQSSHPTLKPGQVSEPITVRFRNSGAKTWALGVAGQQANLGIAGDDRSMGGLAVGWPSLDRVAVQSEPIIRPGGVATFTFRVRAPMALGSYALSLRLVVDGLTWMEDDDVVMILTVADQASTSQLPQAAPQAAPRTGAQTPAFAIGVSADTQSVTLGETVLMTASFTSTTESKAFVGVEVQVPGGETLAYQKWFQNETFAAGQQRVYQIPWSVPLGMPTGVYSISAAAYAPGWKALYGA